MKGKNHISKTIKPTSIHLFITIFISLILLFPSIHSIQSEKEIQTTSTDETCQLDNDYIYNITYALSNIIFTAYEDDEIAKGRYFGSKGEHKAAQILAENMTNIGLDVTIEQLQPLPNLEGFKNNELIEVNDFDIKINGKTIECYPAPSWIEPTAQKNEIDTIFNYTNLKFIRLPENPLLYDKTYAEETEDFVFITQDQWNDPDGSLPIIDWLKPFTDPLKFYMLFHTTSLLKIKHETFFWTQSYPRCKGYVLYDFHDDCYDMIYFGAFYKNFLPTIFINGSIGKKIWEQPEDYHLDIYLDQGYNESVESYNIIGQINGTDPSKTIIVSSLYDCWWNQGTADSAIGTAIVLGIAKYFKEHNIQPKHTLKFICFSGEESDIRGANYYEALHRDEEVLYIIDLNQLGFTQEDPSLTLDIVANDMVFLNEMYEVALQTNYEKRVGGETGVKKIWMNGIPSNPVPFYLNRNDCKCASFFKDGGWVLHHRDGKNHTEGDVFKYYNATDVSITGELILNITKHFTIEQNSDSITPVISEQNNITNNYIDTIISILSKKNM